MWVSSIDVRGLPAAGEPQPLDRSGELTGTCVDALGLWCAALHPVQARVDALADALGWGPVTVDDGEVAIGNPSGVARVIEPARRPQITVEITVQPDPPLFGRLRDAALRDPKLVGGLAEGSITIRAGWLFTPDFAFASLDVIGVALGDVAVPLADVNERPGWLAGVLSDIASRVGTVDWRLPIEAVAAELMAAQHAPDPDRRVRARRALEAAAGAPFELPLHTVRVPATEVVPERLELCVGDALRPLHWWPEAEAVARLVHAVFLRQPDVLALRSPVSDAVEGWLTAQLDGDDATLEQVLLHAPLLLEPGRAGG
jgi:hypothetical protein